MATKLKDTTTLVKRGILYFILFIIVVLFVETLVSNNNRYPTPTPFPTVYPTPNTLFGEIPKPEIASIDATGGLSAHVSKKVTAFPTFPPVINIYRIKEEREYLNDSETGKQIALKLGFTSDYSVISNVMTWESENGKEVFTFDRVQHYFKYINSQAELPIISIIDANKSIQKALGLFQTLGLERNDLEGDVSYAYYASRSGNAQISTKTDEYNVIKVNLNKKILGIKPRQSNTESTYLGVRKYIYYKGIATMLLREYASRTDQQILDLIELEYKALEYEDTAGIYSILSVEDAYKQVQLNKGYLYRLHQEGENYLGTQNSYEVYEFKVDPALTKLIYIEPDHRDSQIPWTTFLQPYYLFEGTAYTDEANVELQFSFLVPALTKDSYKDP